MMLDDQGCWRMTGCLRYTAYTSFGSPSGPTRKRFWVRNPTNLNILLFFQLMGSRWLHIFPSQATNRGDNVGRARSAEKFHRHSERWNLAGKGTGCGLTPKLQTYGWFEDAQGSKNEFFCFLLWVDSGLERELCCSSTFSSVHLWRFEI